MSSSAHSRVNDIWYGSSAVSWLLLPLSWLFGLAVAIRRYLYSQSWLVTADVGVPVIVVGNIAVGGTGKTPLAGWLARTLADRGFRPAVISRGYGGKVGPLPLEAGSDSDPARVGDEAVLLATLCRCPVVVHPDRVAAAQKAIELGANVIVSDDGLQHYGLGRDCEIVVVDGGRGVGNGRLLPAGPLREPVSRLRRADQVVVHRPSGVSPAPIPAEAGAPPLQFRLNASGAVRIDSDEAVSLERFRGETVHAVAGIGNPERFFAMLESHGIGVLRHPLPDHAVIGTEDLRFGDGREVLMTQKDAVKCRGLETGHCWYVAVDVQFDEGDAARLLDVVDRCLQRRPGT